MTQVSCATTIAVSSEVVWQVISDFGAACQYLARVVDCTVEGEGVGAQRTLTSADGSTVIERFEALDNVTHQLSYALLSETPFRDCLTTMLVYASGPNQCEVVWSATFEAEGLPADEAREILKGALEANCIALKQFLER